MKNLVTKMTFVAACAIVAVALNAVIAGAAYIQGFEGSGPFNFYNDPGSSAGISTTVAYSGSQSAEFTLDN